MRIPEALETVVIEAIRKVAAAARAAAIPRSRT